jgi:predicted transcriptional regulator
LENDSNEGRTDNVALSHWEIKILKSITKEAKGERKIAKDVGLDVSTTSQLITRLMLNGFVDKINKQRRMRPFSYIEQFATTPEGLVELEDINRRSSNTFEQVMNLLKERGEEIFFSYTRRNDLPVKIPLHILKITYKFAKFLLK